MAVSATNNGANLAFKAELWCAADARRSNMDAAKRNAPHSKPAPLFQESHR